MPPSGNKSGPQNMSAHWRGSAYPSNTFCPSSCLSQEGFALQSESFYFTECDKMWHRLASSLRSVNVAASYEPRGKREFQGCRTFLHTFVYRSLLSIRLQGSYIMLCSWRFVATPFLANLPILTDAAEEASIIFFLENLAVIWNLSGRAPYLANAGIVRASPQMTEMSRQLKPFLSAM